MSIDILEICSSLFQVKWIAEFTHGTQQLIQTFQLKSSPKRFQLKCSLLDADLQRSTHYQDARQCIRVILSLESDRLEKQSQAHLTHNQKIGNRVKNRSQESTLSAIELLYSPLEESSLAWKSDIPESANGSPACVWATVNGGEYQALTLSKSYTWKSKEISPKIFVENSYYVQQLRVKLNIELFIKFEDSTGGKLKALNDFSNLFSNQTRCDVHFQLPENKVIGAHLFVLCARSPVFEAMFQHDMIESKNKFIKMNDVKENILTEFLHYLYAGTTRNRLNGKSAQPLYEIADKYDVCSLREECIAYLLLNIEVTNAINLLAWSNIYKIDQLKQATVKFVSEHGKQICSSSEWMTFAEKYPNLSVEVTRKILERI